ncbi:tRNA (adenosine(37)-N6)-threonylcarbamoyltransferase complex ATPase subunit type 1 TsaE [Emticicia sp. 17c]|uniref:tRNA (adenosine(37)-N6)-threonylcarbamoyltransferase complex ATPase subunit type 1 TsaE n=1 Tax=Emticicia sp. 17c TaxID=3127704 RepID=UPI00301E071F
MVYNITDLEEIAKKIIADAGGKTIWIFEGEMGAGKTTLIKAICKQLGVLSAVQSPTFSIVNEYLTETGDTVYHFDFYRLKRESEALDFGVEEYFDSGNICLLEWAEKIESLLPDNCFTIEIEVINENSRNLRLH